MATSQNALQALIDALQAVAATVPAGDSEAKRSVLLAAAIEKLSATTTLEAEILASVDAILDSFGAQGVAQVASLAAAQVAVTAAKDALLAQAANVGTLLSRTRYNKAFYMGLPKIRVDYTWGSSGSYGITNSRAIRTRIMDKRTGRLWSSDHTNGQVQDRSKLRTMYQAGSVTTVVKQGGDYDYRNTGELLYFLPLALSAADSTPKMTNIRLSDPLFDGNNYIERFNVMEVHGEGTTSWTTGVSPAINFRPRGPWMAYDRVRKTFLYLAYTGVANTGAAGEPPVTAKVYELYANGSQVEVAGVTGWIGFMTYLNASSARIRLWVPEQVTTQTVWDNSFSSQAQRSQTGPISIRNQGQMETANISFGYNQASPDTLWDSSRMWGADGALSWSGYTQNPFFARVTGDVGFSPSGHSTPMWVIETDGTVNVYRIWYGVNFTKDPWSYTYSTSNVYADDRVSVESYDYQLVDHTGAVIAVGEVPLDPSLRRWSDSTEDQVGRWFRVHFPLGFNITDDVVQSFSATASLRAQMDSGTVSQQYGSNAIITHAKMIR